MGINRLHLDRSNPKEKWSWNGQRPQTEVSSVKLVGIMSLGLGMTFKMADYGGATCANFVSWKVNCEKSVG